LAFGQVGKKIKAKTVSQLQNRGKYYPHVYFTCNVNLIHYLLLNHTGKQKHYPGMPHLLMKLVDIH